MRKVHGSRMRWTGHVERMGEQRLLKKPSKQVRVHDEEGEDESSDRKTTWIDFRTARLNSHERRTFAEESRVWKDLTRRQSHGSHSDQETEEDECRTRLM